MLSAPRGGPRAERSSDASTVSVAGALTIARSVISLPHVGHATVLTRMTLYNSTLHGGRRELPVPAFVSLSPMFGGGAARFGG